MEYEKAEEDALIALKLVPFNVKVSLRWVMWFKIYEIFALFLHYVKEMVIWNYHIIESEYLFMFDFCLK